MAFLQDLWNKFVWDTRSLEDPNTPISSTEVLKYFGISDDPTQLTVDANLALSLSAVYRAVKINSDSLASVPLGVFEKTSNGKIHKIDHDLNYLLSKEPNSSMTSVVFRETMSNNFELFGNCYSEIIRNGSKRPLSLEFHPSSLVVPKFKGRSVVYEVWEDLEDKEKKKQGRIILPENMIHIPGLGFNGLYGKSPIQIAQESLSGAIHQQRFGKDFMANNAQPSVVLVGPEKRGTNQSKGQDDEAKRSWQAAHGGGNKGGTAVLRGGWDVKTLTIPPEQAQFLESRKFSVLEVARWFGVQPHLLFDLERATFSNIEQQGIEYVVYTIMGKAKKWEQELDRKLFKESEKKSGKLYTKFNLNGLMRGDAKSRAEYYRTLWNIGALSQNEIRELEEKNHFKGGERHFIQQNMMPVENVDEILNPKKNGN